MKGSLSGLDRHKERYSFWQMMISHSSHLIEKLELAQINIFSVKLDHYSFFVVV